MENRIREKENFDAKGEVTGISLFFLAVAFALMYLPADITGMLGKILRTVGFGLIGVTAYVIPVFFLYAAIDFFLEKRNGVTPARVKSIILILICVSSVLSLFTLDFEHFKFLCSNDSGEGFSAFKALKLLWVSGYDTSVIADTDPNSMVFIPGGLLGGSICVALCRIANKVISIIAVIVFILSQIILVYKISLKRTAKKTVHAITKATNNVYRTVQNRNNPQGGYTRISRPDSPQVLRSRNGNAKVNGNRVLTTVPANLQKVQGADNSLPVDANGFPDIQDRTSSYGFESDASVIYYGEKSVNINKNDKDLKAVADFNYTTTRVAPEKQLKRKEMPKFLAQEEEPAFYDFGTDEAEGEPVQSAPPFELETDEVDDIVPDVRPAEVDDNCFVDASSHSNDFETEKVSATVEADEIPINSLDENSAGFSRTEGRIIDNDVPTQRPRYSAGIVAKATGRKLSYKPAPTKLLAPDSDKINSNSDEELRAKAQKLVEVFRSFNIEANVVNITHGPSITRFELTIPTGVMVSKVLKYQDDIQYAMAVVSVRIEAPIPGKSAIGIEIPNDKTSAVKLRSLLESKESRNSAPLCVPLGRDIPGKPVMCDLTKMPHLLIAGSTGSGKSVCINTILTSILCKATPDQVRMILIDPKIVELQMYNGIPHLIMPVVTDSKKAAATLQWAVSEMTRRYQLFADSGVRNIQGYNDFARCNGEETLPWILIVIDELADLMAVAAKEVEGHINRLAALARAAGMHMIIATQRPSVDVITGTIKSNIASRIAFAVSSGVDSRTILDSNGAEKLLGKGDMLYNPLSASKPIRGQGAFVSDEEVEEIVSYLSQSYGANYDDDIIKSIQSSCTEDNSINIPGTGASGSDEGDNLLSQAVETVIEVNYASVSILQRRLGIGYPRAARLIDTMEKKGYIGPYEGSKPRKVLINRTDWLEIQAKGDLHE
ncbi:MAG: DNA translocase FtsK [Clostridia bacterium]|nr:DNA translocase FtsK [Clostridia bacterium]